MQPGHSASEWKNYFQTVVLPEHKQRQQQQDDASPFHNGSTQQESQTPQSSPARTTTADTKHRMRNENGKQPVKRAHNEETREFASPSKGRGKRPAPSPSPEAVQKTPTSPSNRKKKLLSPVLAPITQEREGSITTSDDDQFETAPQYPEGHPSQRSGSDANRENTVDRVLQGVYITDTEGKEENEADMEDIKYLDNWIESRVKRGKGAKEHQVIEALHYTSIDLDLADYILPYVISHKGPPSNMRGVWTEEDDKLVEGGNARDIEKMERKHGEDAIIRRLEHLEEWRTGSDDDSS